MNKKLKYLSNKKYKYFKSQMTITSADIMELYPKNVPKPTISDLENEYNDDDESELLFFEPYQRLQKFTLTNIIRDAYNYIFHN